MTVYLDAIWLLNFCIDASLLLLTAMILKRKIQKVRLIISALIGSAIVLFILTPYFSIVSHPVVKLLFSVVMVLIAFGFKRFRYFFQALLTFYFSTFLLGGGMLGIHFFMKSDIEIWNGVVATKSTGFGSPVSWGFVFVSFPLLWYFSKTRLEDMEIKKIQYDQLVEISISIEERSIMLRGLVDSGNQLYDPITKSPVMILDISRAKGFLPPEIIEKSDGLDSFSMSDSSHPWESRLRIIPYRGVGQQHEFLVAIKPDFVTIRQNEDDIYVKKVLIGLSKSTLSSDDEFDCIIHPKMLLQSSIQSA
ncbi:sigma-E processing peptidase SpoIIGA [Bacillus suaedaesalsae]|uniref:Sporulation sigma-E factor-processing peptidase n=1 Tax=Bacillus suaedaesalsae TaxID=2810349 RepID=A0ABS2DM27_9BACI|nr:sigma-E processing peptidase SpoIIGA [Bacillus suaedaesalsae]MBM6618538.1 sigma-E processing peptidase SpoIIGA [Bacillus suaedaesalsae]